MPPTRRPSPSHPPSTTTTTDPTAFSLPQRRPRVDSTSPAEQKRSRTTLSGVHDEAVPKDSSSSSKNSNSNSNSNSNTTTTTNNNNNSNMAIRVPGKQQSDVVDLTGPSPPFVSSSGIAGGGKRAFGAASSGGSATTAFNPQQSGAKKLVIKNLRKPTTTKPSNSDDDVQAFYARTWADLESALGAVFAGETPRQPLERLYRGVEDLCLQGASQQLCKKLQALCEAHLANTVRKRIEEAAAAAANTAVHNSSIEVLRLVHNEWLTWGKQLVIIRSTFSYLDRAYLIGARSLPNVNDMLISRFRRVIFDSPATSASSSDRPYSDLGFRVLEGMCDLVMQDRQGAAAGATTFDAGLFRDAVRMVHVLNIYIAYFEPLFLATSAAFFADTAHETETTTDLRGYIQAADALIRREVTRCNAFNLDSSTKTLLLKAAQHELIVARQAKLLDQTAVAKLLDDQDAASMKALYELLRMAGGGGGGLHKKLLVPWGKYIEDTGAAIVADDKRSDEMVVRLLLLRRNLDVLVRDAFGRDEAFTYAMREAFGHFINDTGSSGRSKSSSALKVGEMIAKYIDMLLRGGLKTLPAALLSDGKDRADAERSGQASTGDFEDAELDRQLDHGIELFRFIHGKDVFEAFYKRDLARRLLMGRSASQDAERNMLSKLKTECGSSLTHNLEQMFRDQALSRDEMAAYKLWLEGRRDKDNDKNRAALKIDLQVSVLSAAAWPTYPETKLNLPPDVLYQVDLFDSYYKSKHSGRKLTWLHALSHSVVRARFNKGVKELLVSSFQAAVLVLFNDVEGQDDEALSYQQIREATGLDDADLGRTLQSLACGKVRVLTKHPRGRDVHATDTFTVNKAFTDPKVRIKINQIQHKETKAENTATYERVAADRQFETQAAIVRIMKSRKTLPHAQLVAEVINQTKSRGALDPAEIKQNIEKLIEKDYMDREEGNYVYVA